MPKRPGEILITEETEAVAQEQSRLAARHPTMAYVVGDTIRSLYLIGCLALDLMIPLQVWLVVSRNDLIVVPLLVAGVAGLVVLEYRLYRRLWPPRRGRRIAAVIREDSP